MEPDLLLNLMQNRRSVRAFKTDPIPQNAIDMILEAARWCQSANNAQPWRFIVIRNKDLLLNCAKLAPYGKFIADAPLSIAVIADTKTAPKWHIYDCSMVAHQICLIAWALGLGTCWIGSLDREKAADLLKLKKYETVITILPIGYPKDDKNRSSSRKSLKELVSEQ